MKVFSAALDYYCFSCRLLALSCLTRGSRVVLSMRDGSPTTLACNSSVATATHAVSINTQSRHRTAH